MALFAELRREEEERPKFSDLAWVNELCRVAVACRQGQLSDDHLAERLETAQQLHERAALGIPQMPPLIADRQRWRQILASMVEALERLGQGMGQVDAYLDDHDGEALDAGLELCMSGAQRLLDEYETLRILEDEVPTRLCPMCSQSNPLEATRCGSCSATFPRLPEEEAADPQVSWPSDCPALAAQPAGVATGRNGSGAGSGGAGRIARSISKGTGLLSTDEDTRSGCGRGDSAGQRHSGSTDCR